MQTINFIISGLGGQGILFMTRVLAGAALDRGYAVMGAETHGMAQRGGSVISHLRLGRVRSSLVRTGCAHFMLSLDATESCRNLPFVAEKGRLFSNTSGVDFPPPALHAYLAKQRIAVYTAPAADMALALNAPMSTNLALLGFFSAFQDHPVATADLRRTVAGISPSRWREVNLKVFDKGLTYASFPPAAAPSRTAGSGLPPERPDRPTGSPRFPENR